MLGPSLRLRKNIEVRPPLGIRASLFLQISKITTQDYATFGSVCLNIRDLSVYDGEAGWSLIVYTKLERVSLIGRRMDGQTDRQIDALLAYAQAFIFLSCSTL